MWQSFVRMFRSTGTYVRVLLGIGIAWVLLTKMPIPQTYGQFLVCALVVLPLALTLTLFCSLVLGDSGVLQKFGAGALFGMWLLSLLLGVASAVIGYRYWSEMPLAEMVPLVIALLWFEWELQFGQKDSMSVLGRVMREVVWFFEDFKLIDGVLFVIGVAFQLLFMSYFGSLILGTVWDLLVFWLVSVSLMYGVLLLGRLKAIGKHFAWRDVFALYVKVVAWSTVPLILNVILPVVSESELISFVSFVILMLGVIFVPAVSFWRLTRNW